MKNTSVFQLAIMILFGAFMVIGIIVFALSKSGSSSSKANLLVWGTLPSNVFDEAYKNSSLKANKNFAVKYVQKDAMDFDQSFIEALADGVGPDVVIIRDDSVFKNRNKFFVVPFKNFSERLFKDTFTEAGEVFLNKEGVIAFPIAVDPLVMYWNRDIFSNNQIVNAPKYWDEIYPIIKKVTKKDTGGNILESAVALGEWKNVSNSKEILSTLLLQSGTPIINEKDGIYSSALGGYFGSTIMPGEAALTFFTQFTNPSSDYYTWNRSLPSSLNMFLGGQLAIYFAPASEINSIQIKNPNLNFDVASIPQARDTKKKTVFGRMYSASISKQSKDITSSFALINALIEPNAIKAIETSTNLPPVRRDLLSVSPSLAYKTVFYESALISQTWLDPNRSASSNIFSNMVESITSGKSRVNEAVTRADAELNDEIK